MGEKWEQLIVESYSRDNILHLTSVCSQRCIFCSHQFNPPGTEVFSPGHLPFGMVRELLPFLDPDREVRTGESVSRVIEGEPLCYPEFFHVLELFRERYPQTPLEIVTGGDLLDEEKIRRLKKFHPLRLKVSLNLVDPFLRKKFLSSRKINMESVLNQLYHQTIPYSVTLVAMPNLTGWQAIKETICLAAKYFPEDITIFKPAIARVGPEELMLKPGDEERMEKFVSSLAEENDIPLLLEPPRLVDFKPRVEGVRKRSPACSAGLRKGDIIISVEGKTPRSRVEAHHYLNGLKGEKVRVNREGSELDLFIKNGSFSSSGAIFYRDIDYKVIEKIRELGEKERLGVITSSGAFPLLNKGLENTDIEVIPITNTVFGGSIDSAGLLGVRDISEQVGPIIREKQLGMLVLPAVIFDRRGRDLWGRGKAELEEKTGIPCLEISG